MAKIVYVSLAKEKSAAGRRSRKNGVAAKTLTGRDGSRPTLATVDADGPAFAAGLAQRNENLSFPFAYAK